MILVIGRIYTSLAVLIITTHTSSSSPFTTFSSRADGHLVRDDSSLHKHTMSPTLTLHDDLCHLLNCCS